MVENFLWTEKYRPKVIDECILPSSIKNTFKKMKETGEFQNLLLSGPPGTGKTTVAKALLNEIDADCIIINGSMNAGIDTLRNEIKEYATTISFTGRRKYVILDESDYLNANSVQPALRNFMEEYSSNCGFILTCNYPERIIEPLKSRCTHIEFKIKTAERSALAVEFLSRVTNILKAENVEFERVAVAELIKKYFPDWRRVLNELQRYSAIGKIDSGILSKEKTVFDELIKYLVQKNFKECRRWIGENTDIEPHELFRMIYDKASDIMEPGSIPSAIVLINDYADKSTRVVDQEINTAALLIELMGNCTWK